MANTLAAYAIYSTAQTGMRLAAKLIEAGDHLGAAEGFGPCRSALAAQRKARR
ncbi:hypothetical protein P3102_14410 [Amycolatopsis sp. QT-25]|uniref:hypothetical protein n=1 Tax=Amycolatopsis sp. QT-25 TaxID=3034022 RepID=UPI0023EC6403|nr:hypothetical protein [Amycolatopsis sp. QT-25]WET82306.1 hypothetical protein P3102_14410 [Amycolatopsis sp. QT-25]